MEIRAFYRIGEKRAEEIRALEQEAHAVDGTESELYLKNDLNYDKSIQFIYLAYSQQHELLGALTAFMPDRGVAEISCVVRPDKRRQGIGVGLLQYAKPILLSKGIEKLIYVIEEKSEAGLAAAKAMQLDYQYSEYMLGYDFAKLTDKDDAEDKAACDKASTGDKAGSEDKCHATLEYILNKATKRDFENLLEVTKTFFDASEEDNRAMVYAALTQGDMCIYKLVCKVGTKEQRIVGAVCLNLGKESCFIFGLGVAEEERGKGIGKLLLNSLMDKIRNDYAYKKVLLEVSSRNVAAIKLYTKYGFATVSQINYYGDMV